MTWFFLFAYIYIQRGCLALLEGIAYIAFSEGRRLLKDITGPLFCDRRWDEIDPPFFFLLNLSSISLHYAVSVSSSMPYMLCLLQWFN